MLPTSSQRTAVNRGDTGSRRAPPTAQASPGPRGPAVQSATDRLNCYVSLFKRKKEPKGKFRQPNTYVPATQIQLTVTPSCNVSATWSQGHHHAVPPPALALSRVSKAGLKARAALGRRRHPVFQSRVGF